MHYCENTDKSILDDLKREAVPDEALVTTCCWKRVAQVRGRSFRSGVVPWDPDGEIWSELCRRRGYLNKRQNPRGF